MVQVSLVVQFDRSHTAWLMGCVGLNIGDRPVKKTKQVKSPTNTTKLVSKLRSKSKKLVFQVVEDALCLTDKPP